MRPVNYLYFSLYALVLSLLVSTSIFNREHLQGSYFFFFSYALGQVMGETALLVYLSLLISRYLGPFCFALFIGSTFGLLILHTLDHLMDRILDLSIWETIKIFVLDETWDNFIFLLHASGISMWVWGMIFLTLASIPLIGFGLYKLCEKIIEKKPLKIHRNFFLQTCFCIPCALFFWDFSASPIIHPETYNAFIQSLPWKATFLRPHNVYFPMQVVNKEPFSEEIVDLAIQTDNTVVTNKPNIYLFIIESLREDAITEAIAPHLYQFKKQHTHFDTAFSGGNGTHLSWFTIFHSQLPLYWADCQKKWKGGSPALALLKKWGYQINVYTSAELEFYGMDELLFGQNLQLVDRLQLFHHIPPIQPSETDAAAISKLQKDLAENSTLQQGQLFIIFWDTTHFDYNWPSNWTPKFTPFATEFAYYKAFQSEQTVEQIKRRYWNSVHYMDTLFGNFLSELPNKQEAIIAVVGDHGEEFFEQGHLFHNSHLSKEQTHVPLYFKFGEGKKSVTPRSVVSQMDIFPSLLDYLGNTELAFLEGNSVFRPPKWPFAVTARFNAGHTPYEFSVHNGRYKLIAQFDNHSDIYQSQSIRILSLRTSDDQRLKHTHFSTHEWIEEEFGPAFTNWFENKFASQ